MGLWGYGVMGLWERVRVIGEEVDPGNFLLAPSLACARVFLNFLPTVAPPDETEGPNCISVTAGFRVLHEASASLFVTFLSLQQFLEPHSFLMGSRPARAGIIRFVVSRDSTKDFDSDLPFLC